MSTPSGSQPNTLLDSFHWKELRRESDPSHVDKILSALATDMTPSLVADGLAIIERGDETDRYWATRLFVRLHGMPSLLDYSGRDRLAKAAHQNAARGYPATRLGRVSYRLLKDLSRDVASIFLTKEVSVNDVPPEQLDRFATDLTIDASPAAWTRIAELASRGSARARLALEDRGMVTGERLQELKAAWRTERSVDALNKLYHGYIQRLPENTGIDEIASILGEPNRVLGNARWYDALDADVSLYLETDDRGRLSAWRLLG